MLFNDSNDFTEVFDARSKTVAVLRGKDGYTLPQLVTFTGDFCLVAISKSEFLQIMQTKTKLVNIVTG